MDLRKLGSFLESGQSKRSESCRCKRAEDESKAADLFSGLKLRQGERWLPMAKRRGPVPLADLTAGPLVDFAKQ